MRKLLWLLLPVPLLLLLIYSALPYIARSLIEDWLTTQGFTSPSIQLTHPGWNRLEIPSLSLTQSGSERQIKLDSRDIEIRFDPRNILLKGEITEIRIPRLQIQISADRSLEARLESSATEAFDLSHVPPTLLFGYAPSNRLVIGEVVIDYRAPDQPAVKAQGNIDLTRQQLLSRMRLEIEPLQAPPLTPAYLDLSLDAQQRFNLSLVRDNQQMARVEGALDTAKEQWQASMISRLEAVPLQHWLSPLLPDLPIQIESGLLSSSLELTWPALMPLDTRDLIQAISLKQDSTLQLSGVPVAIGNMAGVEGLDARQIELTLATATTLTDGVFDLHIRPDSRFVVSSLHAPSLALDALDLSLTQAVILNQPIDGETLLSITPIHLRAAPTGIRAKGIDSLQLAPLNAVLAVIPESLSLDFSISGKQVDLALSGRSLPSIAFDTDGRWQPGKISGDLHVESGPPGVDLTSQWSLDDKAFRADWQLQPLDLPTLQPILKPWIESWPSDLTFGNGELRINGQLTGPSPAKADLSAKVALRSARLLWATQAEIDGPDADLSLGYSRNATLSSNGVLHTELIRTGIDIEDTRLGYSFRQPRSGSSHLTLQPLTLSLLGGEITLPELSFDPFAPRFDTTATLRGIQLSEALRLYQQPGLSGETALSGTLPIKVDGLDIQVESGQIGSDSPGWIRYDPSAELQAAAQSNPGLQLALSALSNLQLDQLDLRVNYAANGDLELSSRLRGQNPDWQQGRPIDLSLNIEENLLQLLRSLQMSQRIGESVKKQLLR